MCVALRRGACGEEDETNIRQLCGQRPGELGTADTEKVRIDEHQIGPKPPCQLQGDFGTVGFADDVEVGLRLEQIPKAPASVRIAVSDENLNLPGRGHRDDFLRDLVLPKFALEAQAGCVRPRR